MTNPTEVGKAYQAWAAFNHKAKKNKVPFEVNRWLNVVKTLNGSTRPSKVRPSAKAKRQNLYQARYYAKKTGKPLPPL